MQIQVNGAPHTLTSSLSIFQLMNNLNVTSLKGIAIAKNNAVIPKTEWQKEMVNENDSITIIKATQGG